MRACVTGGAGFIGSWVVERLLAEGHEVTVLDDLSTGSRENLDAAASRARLRVGDVADPAAVAGALAGSEVVFHLAALASVTQSLAEPRRVTQVNVHGTLEVLLAARAAGVRRVVFASSSSVYGDGDVLPRHEGLAPAPCSPYAASKLAGEAFARAFHVSMGVETVSLRFFNVYGPRQSSTSTSPYAAVVPAFADAMRRGEPPTIHGDGLQTRDFTWVGDVAEACLAAARAPQAAGRALNVGAGRGASILDLARLVAAAVGYRGGFVHAPPRPGDVRDSLADLTLARTLLGWAPRVDLEEGVRRVVGARPSRRP